MNNMNNPIYLKNTTVRQLISDYFDGDNPVGGTLANIFAYNAQGTEWASRYDNLLPLVQFAKTQLAYSSLPLKGDEQELHHCVSQVDAVIEVFERFAKDSEEKQSYYLQEAAFVKELRNDLIERPNHVRIANFFHVLIKNWEIFKGLSITYRLLMGLTILEKGWRNYNEDKEELLSIIKEVTDEWE